MEISPNKRKILQLDQKETLIREESTEEKKNQFSSTISVVNTALEVGFSIALPIVGGAILGRYLDEKLGTSPKLTLSLLFLGLFIGVYNTYKMVMIELKE